MFRILAYKSDSFSEINFTKSESSKNFKTLLIGENGTGKTRLLNELISAVRSHHPSESSSRTKKFNYELAYLNESNKKILLNSNKAQEKTAIISNKVIAISASNNDKLPFSDSDKFFDKNYQYCGIRETSNASWTSSLMRKTIENLLDCVSNNKIKPLSKIFSFLSFENIIRIRFSLKKTTKLDLFNCKAEDLLEFIEHYSLNSRRMQVDLIREFDLKAARNILSYFKDIILRVSDKEAYFEVNLLDDNYGFLKAYQNIDLLRRVGLISDVSLRLAKEGDKQDFTFMDASSGESQLLHSLSSFVRYVVDDSLVVIDEPEISLHPNWQLKYISLIDLLLTDLKGCHVVIATHSHFLVTDLKPEDSSLIVLEKDEKGIRATPIESSTLGWSPESVLYRVFNVRIINSVYLDSDLQKAHQLMSSDDIDFVELKKLMSKFESLVLDEKDPLKKFIGAMEDFIDERG
ncbi:hypothetical protein Patl_0733 [Paraglaciecola sp. T6c]|uniref:AAA family ATPase n=1 Tax=Pseudoalteromonas atlantica (strain T6c / ATCC BAA-1087) TaxID=3042615 RepID=UPI00005C6BC9|nr:AAA family ATPase [Paraglaciecola sp. T6c]ABG39261.1 hypothetical protein Patl_0733 [Paraglaciecola sp. T6c]